MGFTIKDPNGQASKVTKDPEGNGRLCVDASQEMKSQVAAVAGKAYASYNNVTFTQDGESGLAYIKNNSETADLVITKYNIWVGSSTSGSGDAKLTAKIAGLAGTLITSGVDATVGNLNFGKLSISAPVTAKKGDGTALTTGGVVSESLPFRSTTDRDIFEAITVLETGTDIAFTWTPPSGNTSQEVQFLIEFYFREKA